MLGFQFLAGQNAREVADQHLVAHDGRQEAPATILRAASEALEGREDPLVDVRARVVPIVQAVVQRAEHPRPGDALRHSLERHPAQVIREVLPSRACGLDLGRLQGIRDDGQHLALQRGQAGAAQQREHGDLLDRARRPRGHLADKAARSLCHVAIDLGSGRAGRPRSGRERTGAPPPDGCRPGRARICATACRSQRSDRPRRRGDGTGRARTRQHAVLLVDVGAMRSAALEVP